MLNYAVYLQLNGLLGEISALTPKLKNAVGAYAQSVEAYLNELQSLVDGQRLPVSSDVAVELQKLISFDGKGQARHSSRKERDIFAVGCVERVQQKIKDYLVKYDKTFTECADACRQLAAQIVTFNGDLPKGANAVDTMISIARRTDALKPYYAQLVGIVGIFNLRAVFDSVLPQAGITN
ncbi:MAG: hypothetical protein NC033_05050 [Clostridiales bacterium]|nr:hypothetical protein [Clostridiales bacterium]